jgi:hypothetical protein
MAILRIRPRRLVFAAGFAVAIALAPAVSALTGSAAQPAPRTVADCPGSIAIGLQQAGAYTSDCSLAVTPPVAAGAAPSAGAIIACRRIAGCLSNYVNGPGNVQVPNRSTIVQQSQ